MKIQIPMGLRVIYFMLGVFSLSIGVRMATASLFGADSVVLLWEGIGKVFHVSLGISNIIFSVIFLTITFVLNKRYIGVGTVANVVLQSLFMDMIHMPFISEWPFVVRLGAMLLGILLISLGSALYAFANIGVGPYIGAALAIHDVSRASITKVRLYLDGTCLVVATLLGAVPSLGAVCSVALSGFFMDRWMKCIVSFHEYRQKNRQAQTCSVPSEIE